ncbi:MAG: prepilin-type N-terminal cleavage/methylation domain-containing protein [bacterium]|nr:prepilin-type N-terminal cleavage/methylation domain-containing protein [bacterium]
MIPHFYKLKRAGFTLIETLVAVALIMIATMGPFASAGSSYLAAADSKNRLTASYLAQEGIEYVRMLRDTTYLADFGAGKGDLSRTAFYDDFTNGLGGLSTSIYGCEGDPYSYDEVTETETGTRGGNGALLACALDPALPIGIGSIGSDLALQKCVGINSCPFLYLSPSGLYNLTSTGSPTIFRRSIQFYAWGPDEEEVVVTVSWNFKGAHSIVLTDYLAPWQ